MSDSISAKVSGPRSSESMTTHHCFAAGFRRGGLRCRVCVLADGVAPVFGSELDVGRSFDLLH